MKIKYNFSFICLIFITIISCETNNKTTQDKSKEINIFFESKNKSVVLGMANFVEKNGSVTFTAKLTGLKPGIHAIHIHEKSDCSSEDGNSAGGHWNPTFKKHGKWGGEEYHKGDIGNFLADENGNGFIILKTEEWCIGCADLTKNILGKGLIVHQGEDDFVTQPTGNSGSRVACSAIIE